jgi:hypothetical protein
VHLPPPGDSPLPVLRITPALRAPDARKHQLRN